MIIQAFPSGPVETNAYVVACPITRQAAIIDPAPKSANPLIAFINEHSLVPTHILLTHSHWDHIADISILKKVIPVIVAVHEEDAENVKKPGSDRLRCLVPIEGVVPDTFLKDGDLISIGQLKFIVIHTPGHTPGGVCFYCEKEHVLLTGDTLFKGSMGNISFPTAVPDAMWPSLAKLAALPPETKVYPGHGPATTIGNETWLPQARKLT
jgi:hydroxyacylglutathione hydrolase